MNVAQENRRSNGKGVKGLRLSPVIKVDCPYCKAKAGERCKPTNGQGGKGRFHSQRFAAVMGKSSTRAEIGAVIDRLIEGGEA